MDFGKGREKIKGLLNACGKAPGTLPALPGRLSAFLSGKISASPFPEGKRKLFFFVPGGVAVIFLALAISIPVSRSRESEKTRVPGVTAGSAIPDEDLFLPAEPDFLPDFLPEREPRSSWSVEDIRPYWKNPDNPGLWRGEIKSAVDKLMEAVP